jgi:hypothetical protein
MPKKSILPWKTKLAALKKFRDLEGECNVPQAYIDPETGFSIGRWVANLRQRKDFLSDNQRNDLQELDFVWTRYRVMPWDAKLELLKNYKDREGDTLVSKDFLDPETGFRLGGWVDRLRQTSDTINKSRSEDLEQLGFVWNANENQWDVNFQLLQEYKREHGHASPRSREKFRGKHLGQWVAVQRNTYSRRQQGIQFNAAMSDERVSRLESIGLAWNGRKGGNGVSLQDSSDSDTAADPRKHKIDLEADLASGHFHKRRKPDRAACGVAGVPIETVDFLQRLPPNGR